MSDFIFSDSRGHRRSYGRPATELLEQLQRILPSRDFGMHYRPCRVTLRDGTIYDRVYVAEAEAYVGLWGVWPEDDRGKRSLKIEDVSKIEESPYRIPANLAAKMYDAGESAMGGCIFTLVLKDGSRVVCVTGNAVDYVALPKGIGTSDIVDLLPHVGFKQGGLAPGEYIRGAEFFWCLYSSRS